MKLKGILMIIASVLVLSACDLSTDNTVNQSMKSEQEGVELVESTFDWRMAEGDTIRIMLNNHPYADAIIAELPGFETLTGIDVDFSLTEEEYYFDKVTYALSSETSDMDVFMTGVEQVWHYDDLDYIQDLTSFLDDEALTGLDYNQDDFFPSIMNILEDYNSEGKRLLAVPVGFEVFTLAYNKRIFKERGLEPPSTFEEMGKLASSLYEHSGPGTYGISLRGTRNWSMINTGYISYYAIFGARDFNIIDDGLVSDVNSEASITMNKAWVDLIRNGTSANWENLTWYDCADELGYGKAAMLLDADIVSLSVNNNDVYPEAGNIAWVPMPLPEGVDERYSNTWTWALSMSRNSKEKNAAWLFMQYFTGYDQLYKSASVFKNGDMPRQSIWEDEVYRSQLSQNEGYIESFEATIDHASILFTPHSQFFETATIWAEYIQKMALDEEADIEELLNELKEKTDDIVQNQ